MRVLVLSALIGGAVVTFVYVCRALGAGPAGLAHTPSQRVTVKCPHSTATLVLTVNAPTVCLVTTLNENNFLVLYLGWSIKMIKEGHDRVS